MSTLIKNEKLDEIKSNCPETPIDKIIRFQEKYSLSFIDTNRICQTVEFADYFDGIEGRTMISARQDEDILKAISILHDPVAYESIFLPQ